MELERGLTVEGAAGTAELRWGYYTAARLGAWGLYKGVLTARIVDADPLRVSQPGLSFVVLRPNGLPWVWPIVALELAGETLTARLGPKERIH